MRKRQFATIWFLDAGDERRTVFSPAGVECNKRRARSHEESRDPLPFIRMLHDRSSGV